MLKRSARRRNSGEMSKERDILLQLRSAKENIEHAKALLIQSGLTPMSEFQNYIKSAISS